jgi:hypothetical protein
MGKPKHEFRGESTGVRVTIWGGDGRHSASISKRYKDKSTGEYKDSRYYYLRDLEDLSHCLTKAIDFLRTFDTPRGETRTVSVLGVDIPVPKTGFDGGVPFDDDDIPF